MYRLFITSLIFFIPILFSGCAGIPKQHYIAEKKVEPNTYPKIKTIALLKIPNPPHYNLGGGIGPATFFFGHLGAAAELSSVGKDTQEYGNFTFNTIAEDKITKYLAQYGYKTKIVRIKRVKPYNLIDDYSSLNISQVDAILDVVPIEVGFKREAFAGPFTTEIGPHVSIAINLVSTKLKKVIYSKSAQYGYDKNPFVTGIKIDSPQNHKFKDTNEFKSNKSKAIDQLIIGIDTLSKAIVKDLASNN